MSSADELMYVVDAEDQIIGTKRRGDITSSDTYRVTGLWISNRAGDILIAQRALTKTNDPGRWGSAVAGTVEAGESYDDNIIKEAYEELGLTGITPTLRAKRRFTGQNDFFCQIYHATVDQPLEAFTVEVANVAAIKWIHPATLKQDIQAHPDHYVPGMQWYAETYL